MHIHLAVKLSPEELKYKEPSPRSKMKSSQIKTMIISPRYSLLVTTIFLLFVGVNSKACKPPFAEHSCDVADNCSNRGGAHKKDSSCAEDGRNSSSLKH